MKYIFLSAVFALLCLPCAWADTISRGGITVYFDAADRETAESSLAWLLEASEEFASRLPIGEDPVEVYVAHTLPEFQHRAGPLASLDVSGVARSWRGEIIVKAPHLRMTGGDYRGTLRHELVHVLLFRNSNTDVMPRWLNEGLCMMMANEYRWASTLAVAKMFVRNGIIPYRLLDRALRAPESGMQFSDAYAQSLSMTRALYDKVGEEAFWAMIYGLREQDFPDALVAHSGVTITEFWTGYRQSLWQVALIGTLASGSLFGPAAILVIVVWIRKRFSNRRIIRRWEAEEAATEDLFSWDQVVEDPDAWKQADSDPD
jgi:hypothetical protein